MKNKLLQGTIILTAAGFLSRVMGFLYKIYLAGAMSEERMGLYQLLIPIYSICFTIYASGIQTGISKQVAEGNVSKGEIPNDQTSPRRQGHTKKAGFILRSGLLLSLPLALFLSVVVYFGSDLIAQKLLNVSAAAPSLRILAGMFPFCSITACLNGYYYGKKRAGVPAGTQLLEQIARITFVILCGIVAPSLFPEPNGELSCERAAAGIVVGEIVSCFVSLLFLLLPRKTNKQTLPNKAMPSRPKSPFDKEGAGILPVRAVPNEYSTKKSEDVSFRRFTPILQIAVPLTANHLVLSLLHSYETILIPTLLGRGGFSPDAALGTLGVISGMVMPFLLFPTAITSALAILLLPTISEIHAGGKTTLLQLTIRMTLKATFLLGILTSGVFLCFGRSLCILFFRNEHAGACLQQFALLCPILYATQTTGSILNGLSRTNLTFRNSVLSCIIRLLLQVILIPRMMLTGYLLASFFGTLLQLTLDLWVLRGECLLRFDIQNSLVRPVFITILLLPIFYPLNQLLSERTFRSFLLLAVFSACYCILFLLFQGRLKRKKRKAPS